MRAIQPIYGKVGVIGLGGLGAPTVAGLSKFIPTDRIIGCTRTDDACKIFSEKYGISTTTNPQKVFDEAQHVIVVVKPHDVQKLFASVSLKNIPPDQSIISFAAGVSYRSIRRWMKTEEGNLFRCMPATPAREGASATLVVAEKPPTANIFTTVDELIRCIGTSIWLKNENELDAGTPVAGSGPAYIISFMEAFIKYLEKEGLSPEVATQITEQTLYGTALLVRNSPSTLAELREKITTPNGVTYQGFKVLDKHRVHDDIIPLALQAAKKCCEEYREKFDKDNPPLVTQKDRLFFGTTGKRHDSLRNPFLDKNSDVLASKAPSAT